MANKQTAVEWLYKKLQSECLIDMADELFNLAKSMEKEQIINSHLEGWGDAYDYLKDDVSEARQAEDYYNETYGIGH